MGAVRWKRKESEDCKGCEPRVVEDDHNVNAGVQAGSLATRKWRMQRLPSVECSKAAGADASPKPTLSD